MNGNSSGSDLTLSQFVERNRQDVYQLVIDDLDPSPASFKRGDSNGRGKIDIARPGLPLRVSLQGS